MLTDKHEAACNPGQPKGEPVRPRLSRLALIFFLLALSGLSFLLRNILTLEVSVALVILCVLPSDI